MAKTKEHEFPNEPFDRYLTPAWPIHRLLERVQLPGFRWLEPAAGEGCLVRAVQEVRSDVEFTTVEIRSGCDVDIHGDFLWFGCPELNSRIPSGGFDVCITNPPFSLAQEFVEVALTKAQMVAFLLRVDWAGGSGRCRWLRHHPCDIYVIPERIDFTGEGGDMYNYAWFLWSLWGGNRIEWLDHTPKEIRKCDEALSQAISRQGQEGQQLQLGVDG